MDTSSLIPEDFSSWKTCIEVRCRIKITKDFCDRRIKELNDRNEFNTKRFIECYGEEHYSRTLNWFEQARQSFGS